MRVARLFGTGLAGQHFGQGRIALYQALQRGLRVAQVFKAVKALGAPAELARSLSAAQQQHAYYGGLGAGEVENFLRAMLEFGDAAVGAASRPGKAFLLKRVECAADNALVQSDHWIAIVLLVAGIDEGVQRQRIVVRSGDVLFDERSQDASFDGGQNYIRGALFVRTVHWYRFAGQTRISAGCLTPRYNVVVKPSIFVVEDDPDISFLVRHHLDGAGFAVKIFSTGGSVIEESEHQRPGLFLLDIMVPGKDGLELCRQIRKMPSLSATPIIFLTAKSSEADRILGFELGADDYISKPFSPRELVARVKAVMRRFERPLSQGPLRVGDIEIDRTAMTVKVDGDVITTTATEFRLLEYFARHVGRVFSRDQLLDSVWRDTSYVTPRSVDVYVRRIREKIERDPEDPRYLKTVRGAGYRFELPK
jgi:DNA-binding response OmpR family regulator